MASAAASIGRTRRTMLCATRNAHRPADQQRGGQQKHGEQAAPDVRRGTLGLQQVRSVGVERREVRQRAVDLDRQGPDLAEVSARGICASAARPGGEGGMGACAEGGPRGVVGGKRAARIAPGEVGAVAGDELGELCFVLARRHHEDSRAGLPRQRGGALHLAIEVGELGRACALARSGTTPSRYMRAPRALTVPRLTTDCRPRAAAKASGTAQAARTFVRTRITGSRILGSSTAPLAAEAGAQVGAYQTDHTGHVAHPRTPGDSSPPGPS